MLCNNLATETQFSINHDMSFSYPFIIILISVSHHHLILFHFARCPSPISQSDWAICSRGTVAPGYRGCRPTTHIPWQTITGPATARTRATISSVRVSYDHSWIHSCCIFFVCLSACFCFVLVCFFHLFWLKQGKLGVSIHALDSQSEGHRFESHSVRTISDWGVRRMLVISRSSHFQSVNWNISNITDYILFSFSPVFSNRYLYIVNFQKEGNPGLTPNF